MIVEYKGIDRSIDYFQKELDYLIKKWEREEDNDCILDLEREIDAVEHILFRLDQFKTNGKPGDIEQI